MIEIATFVCSICGETSADICVYCTKDTCANHRCVRCLRCSDCCECEVPLTASEPGYEPPAPPFHEEVVAPVQLAEPVVEAEVEPVADVVEFVEVAGVAAIVVPEPAPPPPPSGPSAVEQATTHEELVRALPELFAPEPTQETKKEEESGEEHEKPAGSDS